jgi:hypothetical protein
LMWWMTPVLLDRYIVIKGRPARVVNVDISSPGKHGHAKARFTAVDIFDGKRLEDMYPTGHNALVPNVSLCPLCRPRTTGLEAKSLGRPGNLTI